MSRFDVTKLPANMREKIMVSTDQKLTNGSVCWEWTGALNSKGYGSMTNGRRGSQLTHRYAYELLVGSIPRGLQIDHLCRNKSCLNTDHLEPVTNAENARRAAAVQTHCAQGHPLSGDNLRMKPRRGGRAQRSCITCQRRWTAESERRARAEGRRAERVAA